MSVTFYTTNHFWHHYRFFVVQDGLFRLPEVDGDGLAAVRPTR